MRQPRPFEVRLNGRFLFVVYAYTIRAARMIVAARGITDVVIVAVRCRS